ncbi:MAG: GT4 family glycosyltransferase PelF [Chloroflexi bacterium]|nr:GT4 family glycosyltransferase PelF [Chloroflexota bacterium]
MTTMPHVCLILEGTYPYVSGGVSSWLHSLIQGLPHLQFTIMYVGATRETRPEMQYTLPPNVVGLEEFYIQDEASDALDMGGKARSLNPDLLEGCYHLHHALKRNDTTCGGFSYLANALNSDGSKAPSVGRLIRSQQSWQLLVDLYEEYSAGAPLVDYFWTFVSTHMPLFRSFFAKVPEARVYHTISTGYAGCLAALAKERTGRPMIVTEHGIYTSERRLEIAQANWIPAPEHDLLLAGPTNSLFKQQWIDMFRFFSQVTYNSADSIITITGVNQVYQQRDGADPERMRIIPNGVDIEPFAAIRKTERRQPGSPFTVGFVGRVVPIKDVKTLLRAMKFCQEGVPEFRGLIVGPYNEDPGYYEECVQLSNSLGLSGVVEFTGIAEVLQYYPLLDVLVLTSTSEAVPLVILEANCAGIPIIATDAGACRELLLGGTEADIALGPSGIITPISSPEATGRAMVRLARDPAMCAEMGRAGIARVEQLYRLETVHSHYSQLYQQLAAQGE